MRKKHDNDEEFFDIALKALIWACIAGLIAVVTIIAAFILGLCGVIG